jgi:cytochrome c biogenesis protein
VPSPEAERFMAAAVTSLSDSYFYPAPLIFQLSDFKQVQASVFQVARAPGQTLVYLGCAAADHWRLRDALRARSPAVGVDCPDAEEGEGTRVSTAMSSTRRTLDGDHEFDRLKTALLKENPA